MDTNESKIISSLQSELASLKEELKTSQENQNITKLTIDKIKQIHKEYESSYLTALSNHKKHEENLKNQYVTYQQILQAQYAQNEKRLTEQIQNLKSIINTKTNLISNLISQNTELKQNISKSQLEFSLMENEYQIILALKDKKINELDNSAKLISKETGETISKLYEQIGQFNFKIRTNSNLSNEINNYD